MKTSILKPNMTLPTVASASTPRKLLAVPVPLPPRQPLPSALIDRSKPMLKLGLDVHLELIMAVVPRGHLAPPPPRNHPPRTVPQPTDARPGQSRPWASGRVLPGKPGSSLVGPPPLEKTFHDTGCLAAGRSEQAPGTDSGHGRPSGGAGSADF